MEKGRRATASFLAIDVKLQFFGELGTNVVVGRWLAAAVFALNTCTVGEHSICSRKGKGGYGIRPYDIVEIYLLFAGSSFASKCAAAYSHVVDMADAVETTWYKLK